MVTNTTVAMLKVIVVTRTSEDAAVLILSININAINFRILGFLTEYGSAFESAITGEKITLGAHSIEQFSH